MTDSATSRGSYSLGCQRQITEFDDPFGVAVNGAGEVYVVHSNNDWIQKFDASGSILVEWGGACSANGELVAPFGVAVDGAGFQFAYRESMPATRVSKLRTACSKREAQSLRNGKSAIARRARRIVSSMRARAQVPDTFISWPCTQPDEGIRLD